MHLIYHIIRMQLYTILSACNYIPYYPHANLYPIIPMQIYTLLSSWHDNPPFPVRPIFTTYILKLVFYFFKSIVAVQYIVGQIYS